MSQLARDLQDQPDEVNRLQRGVESAVELISGCDHAGVSIITGREIQTDAATDELVWRGDALQYELQEGPCLDAVHSRQTIISSWLARDQRWPRWAPRMAQSFGIGSMLSVLLFTSARSYGALNLYSDSVDGFDGNDLDTALAVATHVAVSVADARELHHQQRAVANRTTIGQAEGILMERLGLTAEQAFEYLRRVSSVTNTRLVTVAHELVTTRILPLQGRVQVDDL